ncbi:hypothetical protein [Gloeomargarita lithophora]|uniref:hypothetical protein n=1 Tax=Gloeomargarita lithophora TaxID=1188228 RepID=UPI0008F925E1|nr:hypothetical protein [Gloeomargarita lithophora]
MAKRSHAGYPYESAGAPYGLRYEGNGIPLIGIPAYAKKYNVPETTVRYWVKKKRLHAVYCKGRYGIKDVHPKLLYTYNCFTDPEK